MKGMGDRMRGPYKPSVCSKNTAWGSLCESKREGCDWLSHRKEDDMYYVPNNDKSEEIGICLLGLRYPPCLSHSPQDTTSKK